MRLIGINGLRGSGKDTTFELIREESAQLHRHAVRRAFADKLKLLAANALGFNSDDVAACVAFCDTIKQDDIVIDVIDSREEHKGVRATVHQVSGRAYLQHFGQKHRQHVSDSFWVDVVLPTPNLNAPSDHNKYLLQNTWGYDVDYAVVTDVRYPNEAERVLNLGGIVVEVIRPGLESDGHSSEKPLPVDLVTLQLDNSRDFDYLREQVKQSLL